MPDSIGELLDADERYAAEEFRYGELPRAPGKKLAVVVCMDARIDPAHAFNLHEGDANVIRNAGGRMVEALRSVAISQQMLGTQAVAVIHHTDCGMLTFTDDDMRHQLRKNLGAIADHVAFLPFTDLDQSVRDDLEVYRQSAIVRQDVPLRGFIYDVQTGRLREVV